MGIKQLYNDNLRILPNEFGDVSIMIDSNISFYKNIVFITAAEAPLLLWQLKVSIDLHWVK